MFYLQWIACPAFQFVLKNSPFDYLINVWPRLNIYLLFYEPAYISIDKKGATPNLAWHPGNGKMSQGNLVN